MRSKLIWPRRDAPTSATYIFAPPRVPRRWWDSVQIGPNAAREAIAISRAANEIRVVGYVEVAKGYEFA